MYVSWLMYLWVHKQKHLLSNFGFEEWVFVISSEYDWNSLINTPNHISWLVHEPLTYHNLTLRIYFFSSGNLRRWSRNLNYQCVQLCMSFVKSRNILKTKRTYSSEDELTVKILIWTMLMMPALIPGGLHISQDIVVLPAKNNETDIFLTWYLQRFAGYTQFIDCLTSILSIEAFIDN